MLQRDAMRALAMDDGGKAWRRLVQKIKEGGEMTKRKGSQSQGSQAGMSGTESVTVGIVPGFVAPATQEPAEILREILADPTVTVAEKINAAKALDAIQKRGAEAREGRASHVSGRPGGGDCASAQPSRGVSH
jgi:hypothetical protein